VRIDVAGADGRVDEFGELDDAGFGDHVRAARAVCGDGAVVAREVGALEVAQAGSTIAGAGTTDGDEAKALDRTGDEFAVEAAANEDGEAVSAEVPGSGKQAAVPESVDGRRRELVAGPGTGLADVAVAESNAETADHQAREARDDRERDALLQGVGFGEGLGH